jgi:hypothetical protein
MDELPVSRLHELETIIERGLQTFAEVGAALLEIRDERLYRTTHRTFEAYLRERWDISRSYAHRTIQAAEVVRMLPVGNVPSSEAVARELVPLKRDPVALAAAWGAAAAMIPEPTAEEVRHVVRVLRHEDPEPERHVVRVVVDDNTHEWNRARRIQIEIEIAAARMSGGPSEDDVRFMIEHIGRDGRTSEEVVADLTQELIEAREVIDRHLSLLR